MNKDFNAILFDLDDTLIETHSIFTRQLTKVKQLVADYSKDKYETISTLLDEAFVANYQIAKINPHRYWPMNIGVLQKKYSLPQSIVNKCTEIFFTVYKTVPRVREGSFELLDRCNGEGIKIGLVSHAFRRWINFKLKVTGLDKYFTHIEDVTPNKFKSGKDWLKAIKHMGLDIDKTYVIGDNIKGDIISTYEVGFRKLIWVNREDGWKVYRTGELPEGTVSVNSLTEVTNLLFP
ncbi:MAG: hypothetical protein UT34_C0002G0011 [candidate division WS6 bacterium GW2011_GWF2_39_15]|uniref:Uncharacterized protein n=1 Tax=candidate division WS6 bacterium GW2011_GWF2_39_15 TaxID=1619100 RepID=A0A0G0MN43_9BACT|nr:MAG: hypothetical protein UT34_C0002G0011 [candidate division WS6 bacterium GW2011_GWF2_39_15]